MANKRWIYCKVRKELIPADEFYDQEPATSGVFVRGDLQPYQSMVTGEMVEGRAKHREHLKMHQVQEVGDHYDKGLPTPKPRTPDPRLREAIARHVYAVL